MCDKSIFFFAYHHFCLSATKVHYFSCKVVPFFSFFLKNQKLRISGVTGVTRRNADSAEMMGRPVSRWWLIKWLTDSKVLSLVRTLNVKQKYCSLGIEISIIYRDLRCLPGRPEEDAFWSYFASQLGRIDLMRLGIHVQEILHPVERNNDETLTQCMKKLTKSSLYRIFVKSLTPGR